MSIVRDHLHHLFPSRLSLLAGLCLAMPAMACSPEATQVCAVVAGSTEITATFPILRVPFVWRWLRPETPDNALEYRWEAAFGACSPSGQFEVGEYSFGVQLFKYPGSTAKSGQLEALLSAAQHTFVRREASAAGSTFRMDPQSNVSSKVGTQSLQITVRGGPQVAALVASLPRYALLTVNIPEPGQSYTCYAEVTYQ